MSAIVETESTRTERYQTTVPETVRRALNDSGFVQRIQKMVGEQVVELNAVLSADDECATRAPQKAWS